MDKCGNMSLTGGSFMTSCNNLLSADLIMGLMFSQVPHLPLVIVIGMGVSLI